MRGMTAETADTKARFNLVRLVRESFRAKLFATMTVLILIVSTVFTVFFIYHLHSSQKEKIITEGKLLARLLAHNARLAAFAGNREQLREIAIGALKSSDVLEFAVYDLDGRPLVDLVRAGGKAGERVGTANNEVASKPLMAKVDQSVFRWDGDRIEFFEPLVCQAATSSAEENLFFGESSDNKKEKPIGSVRVVLDWKDSLQQMQQLIYTAILVAAGFLLAGMGAAYLVVRSITLPLAHLAEGVRALEAGDQNIRISVGSVDEISRVTEAFNRMVDTLHQRKLEQEAAEFQILDLNARLEEKVQQRTAELRAANQELESFNYSASHDLRGPLNRLQGFCRVIEEDCGDRLDDELRHYLRRIAVVGEQMERVISAMTALFNVQRRRLILEDVNLSELVQSSFEILREMDPAREVEVSIQPGVMVQGDRKLLWLALENMIGNAWKFTSRSLDALIEFGAYSDGNEMVCFVRDNGVGFNMAYADKLFFPFQRLHSSEEFPGTGVGLAIVQRAVARHNGRVWLESVEGKGTTCFFSIPSLTLSTEKANRSSES